MKTRRLIKILLIPVFLILYYLIVRKIGFGIPCMIHQVTGLNCPGCGVSRMLIFLLNLDFVSAFKANRVVLILLPLILLVLGSASFRYITGRELSQKGRKRENILLLFLTATLIVWGVVRNILKI